MPTVVSQAMRESSMRCRKHCSAVATARGSDSVSAPVLAV
jgi:hypothetical protein